MKNRITAALLALLMLAATSCGSETAGGESISGETTTFAPETERTDGLPDKKMDGFTLNLLHHDNTWLTWAKIDLTADEENGDLINDAIHKRNSYIEDRFDCKLNIVGVPQVSEVFRESVLSGDGEIKPLDDRKGVTGQLRGYYNMLMSGANVKYFEMDKDNYPYFALAENESSINFVQHLLDLANSEPDVFMHDDTTDVWSPMVTLEFKDEGSLFTYDHINSIQTLRDMKDDFGILPAPKRDEAQDKYYSYTNIGEIATLPRNFDMSRTENVGMILEAMCFNSQENLVPTYKKVVVQTKSTRDDESIGMLDYVFDGISFDYGMVVLANTTANILAQNVLRPKSTTLVSTLTSMKSSLDS